MYKNTKNSTEIPEVKDHPHYCVPVELYSMYARACMCVYRCVGVCMQDCGCVGGRLEACKSEREFYKSKCVFSICVYSICVCVFVFVCVCVCVCV